MANETFCTHRSVAIAGVHRFRVVGHSLAKGNSYITSKPFRVAGHDWAIRYYPNGSTVTDGALCTSVYLMLLDAGEREVTASYSFCLQDDPAAPPAPGTREEKHRVEFTGRKFSSTDPGFGPSKFIGKADLAASGCLRDDCLVIKCTVQVITFKLIDGHEDNDVVVPPSDMDQDVGNLLESGLAADITVKN